MALVLVLAILVLMTSLVVALLSLASNERASANISLQRTQAEILADAAADAAMGTIADAIVQGSQPNKSWASEPGKIWIFDIAAGSGTISSTSVDLLSALPNADPDNVDLNAPSISGEFPIAPPASGQTVANMKVGWANVLSDPSQAASLTNPLIGRVAYWVDDESCKVNINTANGSLRTNSMPAQAALAAMASTQKYSFGFGTPSEISLAALPGLDQTKAATIADYPWQQEYNSAEEITRAMDSAGAQAVTRDMFKALRFDITHYNSSPDLNFMGEPRIELLPSPIAATATAPRLNSLLGAYNPTKSVASPGTAGIQGLPLDHISPQPSQIPRPPYLAANTYFPHTFSSGPRSQLLIQTGAPENDYYVGKVITQYLSGNNTHPTGQNTFTWPKFDGAGSTGFVGKYTPRQLDAITLQILDTVGKTSLADQVRVYSLPGIMANGWLSGQPVIGVGRSFKLTEILIDATATIADPFGYGLKIGNPLYAYPCLQFAMTTEIYFPAGYKGAPLNYPYDSGSVPQWAFYAPHVPSQTTIMTLNFHDFPVSGPSQFGTCWMDSMLTDLDQNGQPAGIDLAGFAQGLDDPDQPNAALYHPYCMKFSGNGTVAAPYVPTGTYSGSVPLPLAKTIAILESLGPTTAPGGPPPLLNDREPGCYITQTNRYGTFMHPAKQSATSIQLKGGLLYATHWESSPAGYMIPILCPLDSMMPELTGAAATPTLTPAVQAQIKASLIPIDITVAVPGHQQLLLQIADPLVNQFPGDWQVTHSAAGSTLATGGPSGTTASLKGGIATSDPCFPPDPPSLIAGTPQNFDGDNPGFKASGGGDPLSVWLPNQDQRIPKQARFPSVGALFSVRTGVFPDKNVTSAATIQQHGAPFRALNMAPSTQASQTTDGGTSYPDWAMLDLFSVPFLPQKPYVSSSSATPFRRLTYGGATIGRMNINNPEVPYPFSVATPGVTQTPPKRNALKALFLGLMPSNSYDASNEPVYTTIDAAGSATLAKAISDYQAANGPFFMAGQIANVPAVAAYLYTGPAVTGLGAVHPGSVSRNDVVRDTVGAITTRSNVFSVWVVAQTIKKKSSNVGYSTFESGDKITSQVRRHYLVERFLETGKDGVPGNAIAPAVTGLPNAYSLAKPNGDDVNATYHPALTYPLAYRWRVVSVDTIPF